MTRFQRFAALLGVVAAAGGALYLRNARAAVPTSDPLTFAGRLTNGGQPVNDMLDIRVELYPDANTPTFICATAPASIAVENGYFRVPLEACKDTLRNNGELWLVVNVGGARQPRTKVGAVPYALEADHAALAEGARTAAAGSNLDNRITTAQTGVSAAQTDITALQGRATAAEGRLTTLEQPRLARSFLPQNIGDPCRANYNNNDSASPPVACFRLCEAHCIGQGYLSGFFNGTFVGGTPDLFSCTCLR